MMYPFPMAAAETKQEEEQGEAGEMQIFLALRDAEKLPSLQDRAEYLRKQFVILPRK